MGTDEPGSSSDRTNDRASDRGNDRGNDRANEFVRLTALIAEPESLQVRLQYLCETTTRLLGCDRTTVLLRDSNRLSVAHEWTSPKASNESIDPAMWLEDLDANTGPANKHDPTTGEVAADHVVVAPFAAADGSPLGAVRASFDSEEMQFDSQQIELVTAMAWLARSVVLDDRNTEPIHHVSDLHEQARITERHRIDEAIHDDPLQRVFALHMRLQTIRDHTTDDTTRPLLDQLATDCKVLSDRLRGIAFVDL